MIAARRLERSFDARLALVALLVLAACLAVVTPARAAVIADRVSVGSSIPPTDLGASSVSVSQNGQWAVFESATTFASGGASGAGATNIYLRDRTTKQTYCVTRGAIGSSHTPAISGDGNYIVFVSDAPTSGAPAGTYRVSRADVEIANADATPDSLTRVDVAPGTTPGVWINSTNTPFWYSPSISNTGQYVAFVSGDSTLPGANGSVLEVYRRDMNNSTTSTAVVIASVDASGAPGAAYCRTPSISGNGAQIAFTTGASLVTSDAASVDIYVRDLTLGTTSWVSAPIPGSGGARGNSASPVMSDKGTIVAFTSLASDLVPSDTNIQRDVFVRNLATGITTRVDVSATGAQATMGASYNPGLSPDGAWVSFQSECQNLASSPGYYAVYLRSVSATNSLVPLCLTASQGSTMAPAPLLNGYTSVCVTAAGPRYVAFDSLASDVVSPATNGLLNAFVVDRFALVQAVLSTPKLSVTTPRHNVYFYVSGTGSKEPGKAKIQLTFYRYVKVGGKYSYVQYKTFTTYTKAGQSSYKTKIKLPYVGSWYVLARQGADASQLGGTSPKRSFKTRT